MLIQEKRRTNIAQQWGNVRLPQLPSWICVVNGWLSRKSVWNHVQEGLSKLWLVRLLMGLEIQTQWLNSLKQNKTKHVEASFNLGKSNPLARSKPVSP